MSRRKRPQTAAEIEAAIRRLEEEKQCAIVAEDRRRGELLRGYLGGKHGDAIRASLGRVVARGDAHLFGLEAGGGSETVAAD